jgi:hypothetical protein
VLPADVGFPDQTSTVRTRELRDSTSGERATKAMPWTESFEAKTLNEFLIVVDCFVSSTNLSQEGSQL